MKIYHLNRGLLISLLIYSLVLWIVFFESHDDTNKTIKDKPKVLLTQYVDRTSGECLEELKRPLNVVDTEKWQKVAGGRNVYVFSAYLDQEDSLLIRVIALKNTQSFQNLYCQLWFDNAKEDLVITKPTAKFIPEGHSRRYTAVMYLCPLNGRDVPYAVSIVSSKCEKPSNLMLVKNTKQNTATPIWEYSLCLTPFSIRYSRAYELVEMIELNRILGVEQFFFYNYSTGVNVDSVLKYYISQGIVQVIQWHLPMAVDRWPQNDTVEVHYFGQLASLNDCLYRNLYTSRYLVYTDLDEFIVPRTVDTFPQIMDKVNSDHFGSFIFRCVLYRKDWGQYKDDFDGRSDALKFKSVTLLNIYKEPKIFPAYHRSKYILKPKGVEVVGIHNIWTHRPGFSSQVIDKNLAHLHHYRSWENPADQYLKQEDFIIHEKYKKRLLRQLKATWQNLPGVQLDIPITNYPFPL